MQIRRMTMEDCAQVAAIETMSFSMPWSLHAFTETIDNSNYRFLVAEENGEILGYCGFVYVLDEAEIPNHYSLTAGAFICNHILYGSLHMSATKYPQMKCLFVHVPATPDIAKEGMFSMEVETIAKALELCVSAAVKDWKENH